MVDPSETPPKKTLEKSFPRRAASLVIMFEIVTVDYSSSTSLITGG
jgi:hypothetical protein